jgi:hypothetical protein
MTEKRKPHDDKSSATESSGAGKFELGMAGWEPMLEAQRNSTEAVAAAYRKAFEGYGKILALQLGLMKSLTQNAAGIGAALYRRPDRPEAANAFAEATRTAGDAIAQATREIMETAGECCVDTMKVFGERATAGKSAGAQHTAPE